MPSASSLPQRLRYLQPFRRKFISRPEELNEDSGPPVLMRLFSKRVHGLSFNDSEKLLEQDLSELQEWLSDSVQVNDPLHFALGFSLIASPAEIVKLIRDEAEKPAQPKLCLRFELPPGAKKRHVPAVEEEGVLISWRGLLVALEALLEEPFTKLAAVAAGPSRANEVPICSDVRFGLVSGRKFVVRGESWRGSYKQITYALKVPGGQVFGSVSAHGKKVDELNWDETSLESYFHSLHVVTVAPE